MPRDLIPDVYVDSPVVAWLRDSHRRVLRGWIQRNAIAQRGTYFAYCMSGAIHFDDRGMMVALSPVRGPADAALLLAVRKLTRNHTTSIVKFNDAWDRIKHDIDVAYELAIELQTRTEQGLPI